jgi:hypothetical protein
MYLQKKMKSWIFKWFCMMSYFKLFMALFLLISTLTLIHCNDPPPLTEIEKLPPKTQSGKGTFGCLVNGKSWVVKNSYHTVAIYQNEFLQFGADEDSKAENFLLGINSPIEENVAYPIRSSSNSVYTSYYSKKCDYLNEDMISGEIIITNFDPNNRVVSGEFEFITVKDDCDTIKVTDGRFDLKLTL